MNVEVNKVGAREEVPTVKQRHGNTIVEKAMENTTFFF
jgi:hypothetical protein